MDTLWQDVKYSMRTLAKAPGFAAVAVLALALGLGANTAIFSMVYSLMWKPLPGATDAGELVSVTMVEGDSSYPQPLSYPAYRDYREMKEVFAGAVAYSSEFTQLSADQGTPERILPLVVSGNYFDALGVKTAQGRTFTADEGERMGAGNVVVLDYLYWQRRFNGDPGMVGKTVRLNAQPFTVIGVAAREFRGTTSFFRPTLYLPVTGAQFLDPRYKEYLEDRQRGGGWSMVARLKPGVSLAQARAAAETQAARLAQEYPQAHKGQRAVVYPEPRARMEASAIAYMPPIALVFLTLAGLVLLVACANVANLLLARASGRDKEIAIRAALGAGRGRIVRQLLAESLLLALVGAGAGLLLAQWATNAIGSIRFATDLPLSFDFAPDWRVFGYALALAVATGVLAGLFPGWRAGRTNLVATLKEGGRTSSWRASARHPFRDGLIVSQVAVSMVLLVCAGLFFRTTLNAARQDLGFQIPGRMVAAMDTSLRQYDEARSQLFYKQLLDRVRAIPGVVSAGTGRYLPIGFGNGVLQFFIEGRPQDKENAPRAFFNLVSSDYFKTMGMPILQGRDFTERDDATAPRVAIINDAMAAKFWPGDDPVGKRFTVEDSRDKPIEIVGVTRAVYFVLPAGQPNPGFYLPEPQRHRGDRILHVLAQGDPAALIPAVRAEILALDPEMPIWDVRTLAQHIFEGKMFLFNVGTGMITAFGLIGISLAAVGLYGVMAYLVGQRTHEIGVRMALGASSGQVLCMVVRQGMFKTSIGIVLGVLAAFGVTRLFTFLLVGVTPTDPLTYALVVLFLAAVAVVASLVPAWRASRVDPLLALRCD
jgi:predicted permease